MEKQQKLSTDPNLRTENGEAYEIPAEGSLGLLALGYSGLMLWRKRRAELRQTQEIQQKETIARTNKN